MGPKTPLKCDHRVLFTVVKSSQRSRKGWCLQDKSVSLTGTGALRVCAADMSGSAPATWLDVFSHGERNAGCGTLVSQQQAVKGWHTGLLPLRSGKGH